jgi:hypothetical protein
MRVLRSACVKVAGSHPAIPKGERASVRFWGFSSGVIILAGIVYAFFGGWYWAAIGIVVGFAIEAANARSAQQFIVDAAAKNPAFKAQMMTAGVLLAE